MALGSEELRKFGIFADYSTHDLEDFVEPYLTELVFQEGDVICRERAPGNSCFFLIEGEVGVETTVSSGRAEEIGQIKAGTVFGQVVLLDGGARSASCIAKTACRVAELTRADFEAMRAQGSRLALDLQIEIGQSLARQIRSATNNLSAMSETRVEDPMALSQRLETFLAGGAQAKKTASEDSGVFKIKDFEL